MLSFHTQRQSRNSTKWYQMNQVKCRQVAKTRLLSACEVEVQVHSGVLQVPEVDSRNHHRSPRSQCSPVQVKKLMCWGMFDIPCLQAMYCRIKYELDGSFDHRGSPHPAETLWWLGNPTIVWCSLTVLLALGMLPCVAWDYIPHWPVQFQLRPFCQTYATCGLISVPFAGASFCRHLVDFTWFCYVYPLCLCLHSSSSPTSCIIRCLGASLRTYLRPYWVQTSKEQLIPRFSLGHSASCAINSGCSNSENWMVVHMPDANIIKAFGTVQLRMQHPAWQRAWPELPANIEDQCWAVWEIWKKKPMSLSLLAKWIWAMHVLSVPSERKLWSNWRSKDSVQPDEERHPLHCNKKNKRRISECKHD